MRDLAVSSSAVGMRCSTRRGVRLVACVAVVACGGVLAGQATAASKTARIRVVTRNLNLEANLELGVRAAGLPGLVNAAGTILQQVDRNNFPMSGQGPAMYSTTASSSCERVRDTRSAIGSVSSLFTKLSASALSNASRPIRQPSTSWSERSWV
jgi:hypothetical protein